MKNFIEKFKEAQSDLLTLIKKRSFKIEIVHNSSPNQKTDEFTLSHSEALKLSENYSNYLKESRRFDKDSTKVVISRKIFANFLEKVKSCNLFLFTYGFEGTDSGIDFPKLEDETKQKLLDTSTNRDRDTLRCFSFIAVLLLLVLSGSGIFVWLKENIINKENSSMGFFIGILLFVLIFFCSIFAIIYYFREDKLQKEAIKKIPNIIKGNDFFKKGYCFKNSSNKSYYDEQGPNEYFQVSFTNAPDYSKLLFDSLKLQGKIGFLVRRNDEARLNFTEKKINCLGPVIPVLVFENIIVFDVNYLDIINGDILLNNEDLELTLRMMC